MKPTLKHVAAAGLIAAFATPASALLIPITENIRPVEKLEEIGGVQVKVVTITVVEGSDDEPIIKTVKEYVLPAEEGEGTVKYLIETTTTVVSDGNGKVIVTTSSDTTTTPINSDGQVSGPPVTVPGTPQSTPPVDLSEVDIPEETVVAEEPNGPLDTPTPISGQ